MPEFNPITKFGGGPYCTAQQNTDALLAAAEVGGVELPAGAYKVLPIIGSELNFAMDYFSIKGDGLKHTVLVLEPGSNRPMLDCSGNSFFDVSIEGVCFWAHQNAAPFIFRVDSGRWHYRVAFRDVWFRGNAGDGLWLEKHRFPEFDRVVVSHCTGTGVVMRDCVSASGRLDIEQCGHGILIEGSERRKDVATVLQAPYMETIAGEWITLKDCCGVEITAPAVKRVRFSGRLCHDNYVRCGYPVSAIFENGAHHNVVFHGGGPAVIDDLGNAVGRAPRRL